MTKVLQFLSIPNDEKQYATYIDSKFIGTSAGILYSLLGGQPGFRKIIKRGNGE